MLGGALQVQMLARPRSLALRHLRIHRKTAKVRQALTEIETRHDDPLAHAYRCSLLALDSRRDAWRAGRCFRQGGPGFARPPRLSAGMAFSWRRHRVGRAGGDGGCPRIGGRGGRHRQGPAQSCMACLRISGLCQATTSPFLSCRNGSGPVSRNRTTRSRKAGSSPGRRFRLTQPAARSVVSPRSSTAHPSSRTGRRGYSAALGYVRMTDFASSLLSSR